MNRIWLRLLGLLVLLIAAAALFGQDWRHASTTDLISIAIIAFFFLVWLVIMWRVPPARMVALPLGKLVLIGAGLFLASFAWLAFGLMSNFPPLATMVPFVVLLMGGVLIFVASAGLKFYKWASRGS